MLTALLAGLIALTGVRPASAQPPEGPVSITYVRGGVAKPPGLSFYANLRLHNSKPTPLWFLLPYDLDRPLAEDGVFRVEDWLDKPFVQDTLYGRGKDRFGEACRVTLIGRFRCYRLAPGATLAVSDEPFHASRGTRPRTVQVWEAAALLVDGATPFEKWVPFNISSDPDLSVPSQFALGEELAAYKRAKDLHAYHHPVKWPEQKVTFMKASQIEKRQVPAQGVPE
jgi:hypothetical protein